MSCGRSRKGGTRIGTTLKPIEKVFAEFLLRHQRGKVAIGRRYHPHAYPDVLLAADPVEFALLQHAQQLGLRCAVQIADLIQENGAAVGQFELPAAQAGRAGERSLFVAEQLAFEQFGWDRGAIHLHERAGGERALAMDVSGQQLLAGSGFADQQHARVGPCGHGGLLHDALEDAAFADHLRPLSHQLAQPLIFAAQIGLLQGVLDGQQHAVAARAAFRGSRMRRSGSPPPRRRWWRGRRS